jgi:flagellar motor switch protein FliN/FliY
MSIEVSPASAPNEAPELAQSPAAITTTPSAAAEPPPQPSAAAAPSAGYAAADLRRPMEAASPSSSLPPTPEFLLDVRLTVSVEVGRVPMSVRDVMDLGPGAVVELQRGASEPVDVYANGRPIGRGEIVVVGEQFGVRITELGPTT